MSTTIKTVLVLAFALAGGVLFLQTTREGPGSGHVAYATSLEEGLETARAKKRPVFLYFGGRW